MGMALLFQRLFFFNKLSLGWQRNFIDAIFFACAIYASCVMLKISSNDRRCLSTMECVMTLERLKLVIESFRKVYSLLRDESTAEHAKIYFGAKAEAMKFILDILQAEASLNE